MLELPFLNTKVVRMLNRSLEYILIITGVIIIMMTTYYVVTRYLLNWNFKGFEEIAILLIVWMYFIGSANASREQSHIAASMLDMFIKNNPKFKAALQLFYRLVAVVVICVMIWLCVDFLVFSAVRNVRTTTFKWPMYFYHSSMLLGFLLMLFYETCHTVSYIFKFRRVLRNEREPDTSGGKMQ